MTSRSSEDDPLSLLGGNSIKKFVMIQSKMKKDQVIDETEQ